MDTSLNVSVRQAWPSSQDGAADNGSFYGKDITLNKTWVAIVPVEPGSIGCIFFNIRPDCLIFL